MESTNTLLIPLHYMLSPLESKWIYSVERIIWETKMKVSPRASMLPFGIISEIMNSSWSGVTPFYIH